MHPQPGKKAEAVVQENSEGNKGWRVDFRGLIG
jgi:hypothetical protein